jgi:hypothetical protein
MDRMMRERRPGGRRSRSLGVQDRRDRGTVPPVDWGFVWIMFALKIPLIALLWIVWWAVHARPEEETERADGDDGGAKRRPHPRPPRRRPPRRGPHGDPALPSPPRTRSVVARARRVDPA